MKTAVDDLTAAQNHLDAPSQWSVRPLRQLCLSISTGPFGTALGSDDYVDDGVPVINPSHITETGCAPDPEVSVSSETAERLAAWKLAPGDLVVARRGELGRAAVIAPEQAGWICGTGSLRLTPDTSKADARYLLATLRSQHSREWLELASVGSTMANISERIIGALPVAVPPSPAHQSAIAAFLDRETGKIDALVAEQERLMALLKEKRQAVISQAVTKGLNPNAKMKPSGVEWLGEVPAHWEVRPLAALVRSGTSITYGIVQAGPDVEDGVPYIRTSDMSGASLPEAGYLRTSVEIAKAYDRSRVEVGDLVIAIRATIGKTLPVPEFLDGANLTQGTAKIAPGPMVHRGFLLLFLNSSAAGQGFDSMSKGATFKEITLDMLRKFRTPVPPLDEQVAIADGVAQLAQLLDQLASDADRAITLLKERRAALISAAVTGKIDVRDAVMTEAAAA